MLHTINDRGMFSPRRIDRRSDRMERFGFPVGGWKVLDAFAQRIGLRISAAGSETTRFAVLIRGRE